MSRIQPRPCGEVVTHSGLMRDQTNRRRQLPNAGDSERKSAVYAARSSLPLERATAYRFTPNRARLYSQEREDKTLAADPLDRPGAVVCTEMLFSAARLAVVEEQAPEMSIAGISLDRWIGSWR